MGRNNLCDSCENEFAICHTENPMLRTDKDNYTVTDCTGYIKKETQTKIIERLKMDNGIEKRTKNELVDDILLLLSDDDIEEMSYVDKLEFFNVIIRWKVANVRTLLGVVEHFKTRR